MVPEYTEDSAFRHLPVIVKPVDRAGSIGITVAYTEEELVNACRIARDASPTGEIIIEKYMEGCVKFDVYYLLVDGTAYLLGSNDTMMCPPQKGHEILQSAWIFPSKRQADFIKRYQEQITKFFKSLDMKDGYITMSAFRDEKDCFYIFESGFRLSGELSFEYTKHAYGIDYLDNLISYALSGSMGMFKLPEKRNVTPLLVINHFAKDGEVKSCSGLSEETDSYWTYDYLKKIRVLKNTNGNGISKIAMSFIPVYALESALKSNMEINATLDVCNENDESLIYFRNTDSRIKNFIS